MKRLLNQLAAVGMVSLLPSGAFAGVIYDQSIDLSAGGGGSDFDLPRQFADDFQLQSGASTITDIHWWGFYCCRNIPTEPDAFTIRFFADAGGMPATAPLHEFPVGDVGRVHTGVDVPGFSDVYAYSVDIAALTLAADTTFWLSIVNNTVADLDDDWFWSGGSGGIVTFRVLDSDGWSFLTGVTLGFQLTDDALAVPQAVPEPASLALFGAGLAGLGALGWRRRKC